ncbi:unnamed protein product [marine sediment metagenome]|uniref:Uncharacterized protein n=1 Tax=marine sediment metagenome TaxID=412755 RepID=X1M835_9ZZZZ
MERSRIVRIKREKARRLIGAPERPPVERPPPEEEIEFRD